MSVLREINDRVQWNSFLLSQFSQTGIFLQSWEWGEFQEAVGRGVYRYQSQDGLVQVIELPLPLGKKYWFIPRGTLIAELEEKARQHGALFARFEPTHGVAPPGAVKTKSVSPTQTLLIDLAKSEDALLAGMHEKTRYNIRLAVRKGVRCKVSGVSGFEQFWKMLEETATRDGFYTHEPEYYKKMLDIDGAMQVKLYMAYSDATPLATAIVGYFGDTATYLHGASSYEHRALMGPHALHWEIIRDAKKAGYKFYDFWGIDEKKWPGMTRFKMGFGGTVVDYPGTFDLPLNRFWYTLYRLGRRVL